MKIIFNFLFAFAIVQLCWSQTVYTLTGTVYDTDGIQVLPGATVHIPNTRLGANTDEEGHYSISLQTIPHQVVCSFNGYLADTSKGLTSSWPASQTSFEMDFSLEEQGHGYGPFIVIAGTAQLKDGRPARKEKVVVKFDPHRP